MPKLNWYSSHTFRYDAIPEHFIGESVLEVGCSDNILESKLRNKILEAKPYVCVDVTDKTPCFPIIHADILKYRFERKYDTIIMIEVLEHVHLRDWNTLVNKLKANVNLGGYLIISVPAHQKLEDYLTYWNTSYFEIHTIFQITRKALRFLFPEFSLKHVRYIVFNPDHKSFVWALGRLLKRLLVKGMLWKKLPVLRESFIMFWQKI